MPQADPLGDDARSNYGDNEDYEEMNNGRANVNVNNTRTLREYLHLVRHTAPSYIIFSVQTHHFVFKPIMIALLFKFYSLDSKNSYLHNYDFEEVCTTFHNLRLRRV